MIKGRRSRNRVATICDEDGNYYEGDDVPKQFVKHFQKFLGMPSNKSDIVMTDDLFCNVLTPEEAVWIVIEVTNTKIKEALFDIGDNRAPRPDGYTSFFFKKVWKVIGNDVCEAIKEFFLTGQMLGELNATLISLVPKIDTLNKVSDCRPISCCNVLYKCISKVITNRIKGVLKKLVQINQSAFIPERLIQDNILLSQEILRGYGKRNVAKRCAMKIDLQKAYDTVSRNFLECILGKFSFHNKMVGWIMKCVKTAGFSICINGERHGYFKGGRGLRQGDLMSPYLFTLIMEMLTLFLQRKIRSCSGFKYHQRCKELKLVNLCFADDLMIFCNGDSNSASIIKDALKEFSDASGLFPNLNKSTIFFGSLNHAEKEKIKRRLLLISVVFESTSVYWASVFKLPKAVIKEINGVLKRFLWSNGDSTKGKAKLAWKHKDTLWVKWVHMMRLKEKSIWNVQYEPSDSWSWKCLLEIRDKVMDRMQYEVGDGSKICIWYDRWHDSGILINLMTHKDLYDARMPKMIKLADMIHEDAWKWPNSWITNELDVISTVIPRLIDGVSDKVKCRSVDRSLVPFHTKVVMKTGLLCPLCNTVNDSHNHLFFLCEYSKAVWKDMVKKMNLKMISYNWMDIVTDLIEIRNENNIWNVVRRISFAVVVYFIWQERNQRIFRSEKRKADSLHIVICKVVKLKLMNIKVKDSKAVRNVADT
ncbi:RNA-directed DNA polymerase, eukaryota, reverse transcriptase zinc-binding domain protein [Tanacetum coccineum]